MAVKAVPRFTRAQITKMLEERKQRIFNAVLLNLKRIGEQFVIDSRNTDTYKDRTANLRSSIGYIILYNGEEIFENFETKGGSEGVGKAKEVVKESKAKFPHGFVLIGVAGMEYAAAVESKGYDVITASSLKAEASLRRAIDRIKSKTR